MNAFSRKYPLYIIICSVFFYVACEDVFVKDISQDKVILLSPGDSVIIPHYQVNFTWESIEEATLYRVQIVSPHFNQLDYMVVDTLTTKSKLGLVLTPNWYAWKVTASNTSSEVTSDIFTFKIDTLTNLSTQKIQLLSPNNDFASNEEKIKFFWDPNHLANDYRFEIRNSSMNGNIEYVSIVKKDTLSYSFTNDGVYYWGVQAQSQFESPSVFSYHKIIYDGTPPVKPILLNPNDNQIIASFPVNFQWEKPQNNLLSNEFDSLFVLQVENNDSTFVKKIESTENVGFMLDTLPNGVYKYYVRAHDIAGNKSTLSEIRTMIVQL